MRQRAWVPLVSALLAQVPLVGCDAPGGVDAIGTVAADQSSLWADEALGWTSAIPDVLSAQGAIGLIPFLDEEVEWDLASAVNQGMSYRGIGDVVKMYGYAYEIDGRWASTGDVLVDRSGFVSLGQIDAAVVPGTSPPLLSSMASRYEVGVAGIEHETLLVAEAPWQSDPTGVLEQIYDDAIAVAARWTGVWSERGAASVADAYAADARLLDTIAGVDVRGSSSIAERARSAIATTWALEEVEHGPGVYPAMEPGRHSSLARLTGVLLVAHGNDGTGCPGAHAIWLDVDAESGRIRGERRYWDVEDARRCVPTDDLPAGWWTRRSLPDPATAAVPEDLDTVTHRISTDTGTTVIRNGTATLTALYQWGLSRFALGGVRPPLVDEVVFTAYDDYCDEYDGRALTGSGADPTTGAWSSQRSAVLLCYDDATACADERCERFTLRAKFVVLHELAHIWIAQRVDEAVRTRFGELVGVETWNDPDVEWDARAGEWAATFVAWGLLDQEWPMWELGEPSYEVRVDGFQLLTDHQPLRPFDP